MTIRAAFTLESRAIWWALSGSLEVRGGDAARARDWLGAARELLSASDTPDVEELLAHMDELMAESKR